MPETRRPNLLDFTTGRLPQDEVIPWMLEWADDGHALVDSALHECGRELVAALLRLHDTDMPKRLKAEILQEERHIDVLARVGPDHVLLIERKTGGPQVTSGLTFGAYDNLRRSYEHVVDHRTSLGHVPKESVYPIYLETGNHALAKDRRVESPREGAHRFYKVFGRRQLLEVLRPYKDRHHILTAYYDYLEQQERETQGFRLWTQHSEWSRWAWEGLFRYLEGELTHVGDWSYIDDQPTGFLGFQWMFTPIDDGPQQIYLRLEAVPDSRSGSKVVKGRRQLCFNLCEVPKERRPQLRRRWQERVLEAGDMDVERPPAAVRTDSTFLTVAKRTQDWLEFDEEGGIDLRGTVNNLRGAEDVLRTAIVDEGFYVHGKWYQDDTEYLLSDPRTKRELEESIAQVRAGQVVRLDLRRVEPPE